MPHAKTKTEKKMSVPNPDHILLALGVKTLILTICTLAVALLFAVLRLRSAKLRRYVWCAVLLFGLFGAGLPITLAVLPPKPQVQIQEPSQIVQHNEPVFIAEAPVMPVIHETPIVTPFVPAEPEPIVAVTPIAVVTPPEIVVESREPIRFLDVLFYVWLAGIAGVILWRVAIMLALLCKLRSAWEADEEYLSQWNAILAEHGITPKRLPLLMTDSLGPGLVWTPLGQRVLVPRDLWDETPEEIRDGILRHELAHFRGGDFYVNGFARILALPHWFNPVSWFVLRKIDEATEWICDAAAFGKSEDGEFLLAESLIAVHEASRTILLARQTFGDSGAAMKRRVKELKSTITQQRDSTMKRILIGVMLTLLFIAGVCNFRLVAKEQPAEKPTPMVSEPESTIADKKQPGIQLRFVDPDGKPIPKGFSRTCVITSQEDWKDWPMNLDFENGELFVAFPEGKAVTHFSFHCYAEGFTPFRAEWKDPNNDSIPAEYTVVLEPAETIGGVVVDEAGNPVEGVEVNVSILWGKYQRIPIRNYYCSLRTKTDAKGNWRCTMLPKDNLGERSQITLAHSDFSDTIISKTPNKEFLPNDAGEFPWRLTIEKGVTIKGKVVDKDNKPIAGAHVFSNLVENAFPSEKNQTKTDENGEFQFERCLNSVGQSHLGAVVADYAPEMVSPIDLRGNSPPITLTLKPGRPVMFRVIDKDNQAIEGASIHVRKWKDLRYSSLLNILVGDQKTNENGELLWANAPFDEFEVSGGKGGFMSGQDQTIGQDQKEATFVLRPLVKIFCTAIDAETGQPIPEFRLDSGFTFTNPPEIKNPDQKVFWDGHNSVVGKDGKAEWVQTQDIAYFGKFMLRAHVEGYDDAISEPIPPDVETYNVQFKMKRPSNDDPDTMRGTVLTPDGKPASGAVLGVATTSRHVEIQEGRDMYDPPATTDGDGNFRISKRATGINDQDYKIIVLHDSGFVKIFKEDFEKRNEPLRLTPWARIEGTLRVGDEPGRQMLVGLSFHPRDEDFAQGKPYLSFSYLGNMTDDTGHFTFDRVFPGKGSVAQIFEKRDLGGRISSWRYAKLTPYQIKSGETQTFLIGGGGRPVIGKVSIPADSPNAPKLRETYVEAKPEVMPEPKQSEETLQMFRAFYNVPIRQASERNGNWSITGVQYEEALRDWEESETGKTAIAEAPETYKKAREVADNMIAYEKSREISGRSVRYAAVDAKGGFRIDDIPPGNWTITASIEHRNEGGTYQRPTQTSKTITVPDGANDQTVDAGMLRFE